MALIIIIFGVIASSTRINITTTTTPILVVGLYHELVVPPPYPIYVYGESRGQSRLCLCSHLTRCFRCSRMGLGNIVLRKAKYCCRWLQWWEDEAEMTRARVTRSLQWPPRPRRSERFVHHPWWKRREIPRILSCFWTEIQNDHVLTLITTPKKPDVEYGRELIDT